MMTSADLSPQDRAKLAREVGVGLGDGRVFKRGVIVSAGDAARSAADSARNAAFDARTGQYASTNVIDPDKAGREAYSNYLAGSNMGLMTPARTQAPFQSVPSSPAATAQTAQAYWESEDAKWGSDVVRRNREDQGLLPKYSQGGYTGPGAKNKPAGGVHAGEFVIPAEEVKKIGVAKLDATYGTDSSEPKTSYAEGGFVRSAQELMSYRGRLKSPRAANYNWEIISQLANDPQGQSLVIAEALAARDAYALQLQDERDAVATGRTLATQGFIDERQQRQIEANATLADTRAATNEAKAEAKRKAEEAKLRTRATSLGKQIPDLEAKVEAKASEYAAAQAAMSEMNTTLIQALYPKLAENPPAWMRVTRTDPDGALVPGVLTPDEIAAKAENPREPAHQFLKASRSMFPKMKFTDQETKLVTLGRALRDTQRTLRDIDSAYRQVAQYDDSLVPAEPPAAVTPVVTTPAVAPVSVPSAFVAPPEPAPTYTLYTPNGDPMPVLTLQQAQSLSAPGASAPPAWLSDGSAPSPTGGTIMIGRANSPGVRVLGPGVSPKDAVSYASEDAARAEYAARAAQAARVSQVTSAVAAQYPDRPFDRNVGVPEAEAQAADAAEMVAIREAQAAALQTRDQQLMSDYFTTGGGRGAPPPQGYLAGVLPGGDYPAIKEVPSEGAPGLLAPLAGSVITGLHTGGWGDGYQGPISVVAENVRNSRVYQKAREAAAREAAARTPTPLLADFMSGGRR